MSAPAATAVTDVGEALAARVVEFVGLARANGYEVGIGETLDALRIAARCALDRERLRCGLRALLCGDVDGWRRFDRLFDAYWADAAGRRSAAVQAAPRAPLGRRDGGAPGAGPPAETEATRAGDGAEAGAGASRGGASPEAAAARSDFRLFADAGEMARIELLVHRLARRLRRQLRRRWRLAARGRWLHLRRTLRNSLRYGGMPLAPVYHERRRRPPRLVVLTDVSRSMSLYSYLFLRYARGLLDAFDDARAYVFHTRLVPVTEALRERDSARLKDKLAVLSLGWAGGTRIGESLHEFNRQHARGLLNRRTLVIVVSDGLDTGPPAMLAAELAAIKRHARKLIWLNPLLGRAGYEPRAGGMAAALPYIDVFAPAHSLESLAALEPQLARL